MIDFFGQYPGIEPGKLMHIRKGAVHLLTIFVFTPAKADCRHRHDCPRGMAVLPIPVCWG